MVLGACEFSAGIDGEAVSDNFTLSGENQKALGPIIFEL